MKNLRVLAVNSLPVHGMAGLKAAISILGQRVLPVPTVLLNGLTNMPNVKKQFSNFEELLHGTFKLVEHRNQTVVLSIGYLGLSSQVDILLDVLDRYKKSIHLILTDPISGDHDRVYVPHEIVDRWPDLVAKSDVVFPNITELKLLGGFSSGSDQHVDEFVACFKKKYPKPHLILTSHQANPTSNGILYSENGQTFQYYHRHLSRNYGGTGDAFVAYFILFHIYNAMPAAKAIERAADKVLENISVSIEIDSDELVLDKP